MDKNSDFQTRGISIVLGSYNRINFIKLTIQTIRQEFQGNIIPHEIIVIDGGSTDGTIPWLIKQKDIITIVQHNRGMWNNQPIPRRSWGYFINLGFKIAQGKYVCMLSDDCLVIPGAIINGYEFFNKTLSSGIKVGAVAFFWRDWPLMSSYAVHTHFGMINVNHGLFLRSALVEAGYADEDTYSFYYGDVDLTSQLMRLGYRIIPCNSAFIEHFLHANLKTRASNLGVAHQDKINFIEKWKNDSGLSDYIHWDEEESKIIGEHEDIYHTVRLYYPYSRAIRLTQHGMNILITICSMIGKENCEKYIEKAKKFLNNSDNVILKSIQFTLYSFHIEEKLIKK